MDIYFVRHGETDFNKNGFIQGRSNIPLNDHGRQQAKEAADYFRKNRISFDKVYASPLIRAHETASIVSGWDMAQIITDERLQELAFGTAEGMNYKEMPEGLLNLFKKPECYQVPEGGESIDMLVTRCQSFLDDLRKLPDEAPEVKCVLAATHGAALRGFLSCIEKSSREAFWKKGLENCCIAKVSLENGTYTLLEIIESSDFFKKFEKVLAF